MNEPATAVATMRAADAIEADAWEDLYAAAPAPFAARNGMRTERVGGAVLFLAPGMPRAIFNRAVGLGLFRKATESDVDDVVAAFQSAGASRYWVHAGGACEPEQIPAWLRARGLAPCSDARRAWVKTLRGRGPVPEMPSAFRVCEVQRAHAESLARALADAHEMPAPTVGWIAALVGRPRWRAYAAFQGDQLAAGGLLYAHGQRAWLGLGGTLPAYRNRGAQGALLALRARDALDAGCHTLVTETDEPLPGESNPSLSNIYRCGFRKVFSRENYAPSRP